MGMEIQPPISNIANELPKPAKSDNPDVSRKLSMKERNYKNKNRKKIK
jgi:hypothetical protein